MERTNRFETLDAIRGIASFSVTIYHVTQHTAFPILRGSYFAVDIFFCLSGFVIAHSYGNRLANGMSIRQFIALRLIRLYPMFLMGLLIGAAAVSIRILHHETDLTPSGFATSILLNIFYIPYISVFSIKHGSLMISSPTFPANDPGWSLSFEFLVNIAFVFTSTHLRRLPVWLIVAVSAVLLVAYVGITHQSTPGWGRHNLLGGIPRVFFGFYLGVLIYELVSRGMIPRFRFHYGLIFLGIVFTFMVEREGRLWLGLVLLTVFPAVFFGSLTEMSDGRLKTVLQYLGWLSYPLYCVHIPIYMLTTNLLGDGLVASGVAVAVSILAADVLCRSIDEPLRSAMVKKFVFPRPARS